MAKPQELHLIVQTLSGSFEGDFEADQKLQDVIDKAVLSLDIKPSPAEELQLTYKGKVLDPSTTIGENHLQDGASLELAPKESGGGHEPRQSHSKGA